MRIAYLGPDHPCTYNVGPDKSLHPNDIIPADNLKSAILKHPKTVFYTLESFTDAFNAEEISDLGWIAIDKDLD